MTNDIPSLAAKIMKAYRQHMRDRLFTIAISGIDASGKGYITERLQKELEKNGCRVAAINTDPWQNPLAVRLKKEKPAENVYENIFRWNDFFEQLIFPLQKNRNIFLATKGIRSDADIYYPLIYDYTGIDLLLIEGILLFKKQYLSRYDYKIWIDCSFETGLKRAVRRNVENLSEEMLIRDYHTYYYAAQRLHFDRDNPRGAADLVFNNNPSFEAVP